MHCAVVCLVASRGARATDRERAQPQGEAARLRPQPGQRGVNDMNGLELRKTAARRSVATNHTACKSIHISTKSNIYSNEHAQPRTRRETRDGSSVLRELVMKLMCHRFSKFSRGSALPKCHCASTWTTTRYIGHLIAHPHDMFAHPAHSITAHTMAHTHVRSHAFTLSSRTGTAELQRTGYTLAPVIETFLSSCVSSFPLGQC